MSNAYKKSGVNIDEGNRFIDLIKPAVRSTKRRGVITEIGGFAGLFGLDTDTYNKPILVSGTDGVGTKLLLAHEMNDFSTVGIDLVAMCINDIACNGAEPLFFLDYFAVGKLSPEAHAPVVEGIANGCKQSNCALLGGETAEMPGMYEGGDFDLAGFAVGVVNEDKIIDGSSINSSHAIIGFESSGHHSNGYSLVRHFIKNHNINLNENVPGEDITWGKAFLEPTKIYSPLMLKLAKNFEIGGFVHITGGGFIDNIPRILPKGIKAVVNKNSWEWTKTAIEIAKAEKMKDIETLRVFNCGIGLVAFVQKDQAEEIIQFAKGCGETAHVIGHVEQTNGSNEQIEIVGKDVIK